MKRFNLRYKLLVITVLALFVCAIAADVPFTFKPGDLISADQMNQNFATLNNGKQELVKGICAAGSSIRVIAADGSVTCEVDDIGTGAGDAGVDAINGMTGAVTLQAGDNIIIDDSQQGQIRISSSSGGTNTNNHNHFSQTWTGSGANGLTVTNDSLAESSTAIVGRLGTGIGTTDIDTVAAVWGDAQSSPPNGQGNEISTGIGVLGSSLHGFGVSGNSSSGIGVDGDSTTGIAVRGNSREGIGGSFSGRVGIEASGEGTNPDLSLGGFTGIISGTDVLLEATEDIELRLDKDNTGSNLFLVRNATNTQIFSLGESGNIVIAGTLFQGSDRAVKHDIEAINTHDILEKVAALPLSSWRYNASPDAKHVGPMAQDFYTAFGLGNTDKGIATVDADGISLAAIQGLYQIVQEQQAKIEALEAKLATR
jgi:hypothetical protein